MRIENKNEFSLLLYSRNSVKEKREKGMKERNGPANRLK